MKRNFIALPLPSVNCPHKLGKRQLKNLYLHGDKAPKSVTKLHPKSAPAM